MSNENNENVENIDTNETVETTETNETVETSTAAKKVESTTSDADNNGSKKSIYIIEGIIAAIAVVFIIIALVVSNKKNNADGLSASQDALSQNQAGDDASLDGDLATKEIDNSALYTDMPAIPDASSFNKMTEEECLKLVDSGDMIKVESADGTYTYVVNYNDSELLANALACTDEELEAFLYKEILVNCMVPVEDGRDVAQLYDYVCIDYAGYLGDEQFENGTATEQYANLGSGSYIPGFEEGIVGMKVGETKDVEVTFPEDYRAANLAGQDVTFKITLNEIVSEPAELTEELVAEQFSGFYTLDEIINAAKQQISSDKSYSFLTDKFYVSEINDEITLNYYNNTMELYDLMCQQYMMSIDDLLLSSGSTLPDFKKDVMESCAESALSITMYHILAENFGLSVSDDDIQNMCSKYGYSSTEEFFAAYGEQTVKDALLSDKVTLQLINMANSDEEE